MMNPDQRERAGAQESQPASSRGAQHGTNTPGTTGSPLHPDTTRTFIREGVGANGQQWRITVNESVLSTPHGLGRIGTPFSVADTQGPWRPPGSTIQPRSVPGGGQLSNPEVQNILRTGDTNEATRTMTDAMQRNASTSSLPNLAGPQSSRPVPPGVTTPFLRTHSAQSATTDLFGASSNGTNNPASQHEAQPTSTIPEVYILSSPSGPRALLLHSNSETYFTPQYQALRAPQRDIPFVYRPPHLNRAYVPPPQEPHERPRRGVPIYNLAQPQARPVVARPDNPQVEAVRIANLWPALWGLIRLSLFLFIWWFTSPTASWFRLIIVVSIALAVFLANSGLLAPLTGHVWIPVRQHLENLIPLVDGQHGNAQPAGAGNAVGGDANAGNAAAPQRELDPADAAARLVHQRRQRNANWLTNQVRRLERAGILFLASIAPGVAERHIANLEAEARAERLRREAEETAAARARNENSPEGASQAQEGTASSTAVDQQNQAERAAEGGDGVRARVPHPEGPHIAA